MIKHQNQTPRFVLGKGSEETDFGACKRRYRINVEKSIVASLILSVLLFRLVADVDTKKYVVRDAEVNFELIDVLDIPPPPQQVVMEQVVAVVPVVIEEKVPEDVAEVKEIMDQIEELLAEESDEAQLTLASNDMGNYLLSNSPLSGASGPELDFRRNRASNEGSVKFRAGNRLAAGESGSGLDIGSTETKRRTVQTSDSGMDLSDKPKAEKNKRNMRERKQHSLEFNKEPGKILNFSSSTIGTEGYKLWNKVISEIDRLNKGRYGQTNSALKRHRNGFVISFTYSDGTAHEVNWRNDGNIWIRVLGESKRTTIQELRQAYSQILRLSL